MIEAMQAYMPDVRIGVESTLMRRWYKEATPLWEDDAKTIMAVWTPERAQEYAARDKARAEAGKTLAAAAQAKLEAERIRDEQIQDCLVESIEDMHNLIEEELPALADRPS